MIPQRGRLREYSMPKILMSLHKKKAIGTLSVSLGNIKKNIYLSNGEAIFASSNYEDDRLGEMLIKAGKITVEQYDKSVEILKKTRKRQGAILVELGYITPKDLFWGVKYQVKEIIYSLFQAEDGGYEFIEGPVPKDEVIILKMSMGNLICEGIKRIDNWTKIRRELPDMDTILKLSDDPLSLFQGVELGQQEKKILTLIDGKRTIRQIIEDSWLNSFEVMKALYLLWSINILTIGSLGEKPTISLDTVLSPISLEEEAFLKKVDEMYSRLDSMDYFELLRVGGSADSDTIRQSYYALAKEFHPDRFYDTSDPTLRDKLSRIFDALTDAYNTIKDEEGRLSYLASLGRPSTPADTERAESNYKKSIELIKAGRPKDAVSLCEEAVKIEPKEARYWNLLALAYSKVDGRIDDAEKALLEALMLEPANSEYYSNLGLIYMKAKRFNEAKNQFQKALALDPKNQKARKALEKIT